LTSAAAPEIACLHGFDDLPSSAYVRQRVVEGLLSCSASTVWRLVKQGRIPAPRKLGARVTAWRVADLRAALADM